MGCICSKPTEQPVADEATLAHITRQMSFLAGNGPNEDLESSTPSSRPRTHNVTMKNPSPFNNDANPTLPKVTPRTESDPFLDVRPVDDPHLVALQDLQVPRKPFVDTGLRTVSASTTGTQQRHFVSGQESSDTGTGTGNGNGWPLAGLSKPGGG